MGWIVGYAVLSIALLWSIASGDKELIKLTALFLIGWTPIGILMTYAEVKKLWNGTESTVGIYGPVALLAFLAGLSALIG